MMKGLKLNLNELKEERRQNLEKIKVLEENKTLLMTENTVLKNAAKVNISEPAKVVRECVTVQEKLESPERNYLNNPMAQQIVETVEHLSMAMETLGNYALENPCRSLPTLAPKLP